MEDASHLPGWLNRLLNWAKNPFIIRLSPIEKEESEIPVAFYWYNKQDFW